MKAVTWQGKRDMRVETVPDPKIQEPTDAIIRVTSTGLCGSDLHLYEVFGMFMTPGDVVGHEPMGIVEEVGSGVTQIARGDRVVIPFNIACGHCWMCQRQLFAQCETTQVRTEDKGAALFGYSKLYGRVPGGQAEYLRVPQAQFGPIKVPHGPADERFLFLSDVLPTAWQAVAYAEVPPDGSLGVFGLGPIGQMCVRIARHLGVKQIIGIDLVPERLEMARKSGAETVNLAEVDDIPAAVREMTGGRGTGAVIDAVGTEAHGDVPKQLVQQMAGFLPKPAAQTLTERFGVDRMAGLLTAISTVRRGGTVSISGVYGGAVDPMPMLELFDKGLTVRQGQAHVKRWIPEILPLLLDGDPLGTENFASHKLPLAEAPRAYEMFQKKQDGAIKVVFKP